MGLGFAFAPETRHPQCFGVLRTVLSVFKVRTYGAVSSGAFLASLLFAFGLCLSLLAFPLPSRWKDEEEAGRGRSFHAMATTAPFLPACLLTT